MRDLATTLVEQPYEDTATTVTTPQWSDVIPIRGLSSRQIEAVIGALKTENLPDNWDGYGSPPPPQRVVNISIKLLEAIPFDDLPVPHVVPVSGGGIQIEWSIGQRELELEILPDGSVEFLKAERGQPLEEGKLTSVASSQVQSLLAWLIPG